MNFSKGETRAPRIQNPRTDRQRRFYFGTVVKALSEQTGYASETMHECLKMMFIRVHSTGFQTIGLPAERDKNGRYRVGSTTDFSSIDQEQYNECIREWTFANMKVIIPMPTGGHSNDKTS